MGSTYRMDEKDARGGEAGVPQRKTCRVFCLYLDFLVNPAPLWQGGGGWRVGEPGEEEQAAGLGRDEGFPWQPLLAVAKVAQQIPKNHYQGP